MKGIGVKAIAFVGYPVTDVDRAKDFYGRVLGLDCTMDHEVPEQRIRWIEYDIGAGTLAISNAWAPGGQSGPSAALEVEDLDVLEIPEGLSGRRPLPDETFRYGALHRALYLQLLPHVGGTHRLLIDLHSGLDQQGPSADLLCADTALRARLRRALDAEGCKERPDASVRIVPLGQAGVVQARTVIPEAIWNNPAFAYLGMELYLPVTVEGRASGAILARRLVRLVAGCMQERGDEP